MNIKPLIITLLLLITIPIFGCKKTVNPEEKTKKNSEPQIPITFQNLQTSIDTSEFAKIYAELVQPRFKSKNSEIIIVVEMEDTILKQDLSNQKDANLAVFHNLSVDTINRKFVPATDYKKAAIFGRKFNHTGLQTIKGYVMEFYGFEVFRGYDIFNDTLKSEKTDRTYFEIEIYVKENKTAHNNGS